MRFRYYGEFLLATLILAGSSPVWAEDAVPQKAESPIQEGTKESDAAKPAEQPAKPAEAAPKTPEPATVTVKKGPIKVSVKLDGVFEAQKSYDIVVKPEEWNSLVIDQVAAHGERVRKDEVILSLDTQKIDRAIADLQADIKLAELAINQSEEQLQVAEQLNPLDMEASERAAKHAQEDNKTYFETERPFALKQIDFQLKVAEQKLEYDEEELRQLEKMYKADDLTEETEEIVLRRARDTVERTRFYLESIKLNRDLMLRFSIPRMDETVKDSTQRSELDWQKTKATLPLAFDKQRIELERQRVQRQRSLDKLTKLQADREMMTVKSPADGIVYYGKSVRGRFGDSNSSAENLRRFNTIQPNQVVMTVVAVRPMSIRAAVPEDQLHWLRPGMKGIATPTGYPKLKLTASLDEVSDIPVTSGSFDAQFNVSLERKTKMLMPGMTCKIKIVPYKKQDALCIPQKCVSTDETDDEKHFVYVLGSDGKPEKRDVELGEKSGKQVEIAEGLAEGEKVLLEAPKDAK